MQILDGKSCASAYKERIAAEVATGISAGKRKPHLAAVLVGNDGASETYVASKVKTCKEIGFESTLIRFPETVSQAELIETVEKLNADDSLDGILVQLPLPKHIDSDEVTLRIDPTKRCGWISSGKFGKNDAWSPWLCSCHTEGHYDVA